jgi:hypothetical protein
MTKPPVEQLARSLPMIAPQNLTRIVEQKATKRESLEEEIIVDVGGDANNAAPVAVKEEQGSHNTPPQSAKINGSSFSIADLLQSNGQQLHYQNSNLTANGGSINVSPSTSTR